MAQTARGVLRVQLTDGTPVSVIINGRDFDREERVLTFGDMPARRHTVQVYAQTGRRGGGRTLVYTGRVRVEPAAITICTVDPFRRTARIQTRALDVDPRGGVGGGAAPYRPPVNNAPRQPLITDADIRDVQTRAADRITDADKLATIRAALANRAYYADQLRPLALLLTFDETRLEFLKGAYAGAVDPENYWKLEDVLSFDASKQELNNLVSGRR